MMDEYEQYLADIEYENYLNQVQAEDVNGAMSRSAGADIGIGSPVPFQKSHHIGPDYNQSLAGNALLGVTEAPEAAYNMVGDAFNTISPYNTNVGWQVPVISPAIRAGPEKTARTVGSLSAGVAGAGTLAPIGAGWGSAFGPIGTAVGGVLGGAAGFGGGLLGFSMIDDAISQGELRPVDQYAKDLAYNTSQGAVLGGASTALMGSRGLPAVPPEGPGAWGRPPGSPAVPGTRGIISAGMDRVRYPFSDERAASRVVGELNKQAPGWVDTVNQAFPDSTEPPPPPGSAGAIMQTDPFLEYKSLGELLDNPVLKNQQRTLARMSPEGYGAAAEANALRNDAQLKYLDSIETSPVGAADAQASIAKGIEGDIAAKQSQVNQAQAGVESLVSQLPPAIDLADAGTTIRAGVSGGINAQRGKVTAGFEGAGNGAVPRDIITQTIQAEVPKYFREVGAQPTGALATLIEDLTREGQPIMIGEKALLDANGRPVIKETPFTVRDMQAMRSKAIEIVKGSDARSSSVAGKIIQAIDESLDAAVNSGSLSSAEITSLREGIAARKAQGVIFEGKGNPNAAVLDTNYSGSYVVPDSAVPNRYFRPGQKGTREAMQKYKAAFGSSAEALDPIHRYAADSFRRATVGEDGLINIKKARSWLDQHSEVLKELPEVRRQFENIETAQSFLNEKFGDLKRTTAEVQKGALQLWLKDIDPKVAIREMLSGRDIGRRVKSTVDYLKSKDPDAVAGLRRGVVEYLEDKVFEANAKISIDEARLPGGPRFDGRTRDAILGREWLRIRPSIERSKLFTDSQIKNFDYLYKDKASQLSVEQSKMPGGSDTVQNSTTLAALTHLAGNTFLRGYPVTRYVVSVIAPILKKLPEGKFLSMLQEANLNPRFARDLQNKATAKNVTRSSQAIFKNEIAAALGSVAPFTPTIESQDNNGATAAPMARKNLKPFMPKQQDVTSKKSFPKPEELLKPAAPGNLKKTSFNLQEFIKGQAPETQARISVESSGDPYAESHKGAQGLSQLMPETAKDIARELGETYLPLNANMTPEQQQVSIEQNVRFGNHYLKNTLPKINKAFKNPTLAWAAYNAGPGRVQEAMAMAGSSTDVNKILSNLPKRVQQETVPYVNEIMARLTKKG